MSASSGVFLHAALLAPRYRINPGIPGSVGVFAEVHLGPVTLHIHDPSELRRLADVAANAADVLEAAQRRVEAYCACGRRVRECDGSRKGCARPASRCCDQATHDALRESDAWNRLEFVGYQDDGQGGRLELRNCPCGATLAILARESPSAAEGAGMARVAG